MRFVYGLMIVMGGLAGTLSVQAGGETDDDLLSDFVVVPMPTPDAMHEAENSMPEVEELAQRVSEDEERGGVSESTLSDAKRLEADLEKNFKKSPWQKKITLLRADLLSSVIILNLVETGIQKVLIHYHSFEERIEGSLKDYAQDLEKKEFQDLRETFHESVGRLRAVNIKLAEKYESYKARLDQLEQEAARNAHLTSNPKIEETIEQLDSALKVYMKDATQLLEKSMSLHTVLEKLFNLIDNHISNYTALRHAPENAKAVTKHTPN
jgi:methyl-accepting chemotaxis protein